MYRNILLSSLLLMLGAIFFIVVLDRQFWKGKENNGRYIL